jgi:hypothetical protein
MGMFRESDSHELDIVKEMAESLGSTGYKLEEILDKLAVERKRATLMIESYTNRSSDKPLLEDVNSTIRKHNKLVDEAEDTLRWLLIQREACGFRTHKNVSVFYPIPAKIRLLKA